MIDGADNLFETIGGISTKVGFASQASSQAMHEIERTTETVKGLSDQVAKIGEVSTLINGIALQTNLLALNATIEAARAGEAGKGFSVVAQEVKNLADQTRHATGTIKNQIVSVRAATHNAVDAIAMVKETIRSIHELSGAASVDILEQEAFVRDMAQSLKTVSASGQLISNGMGTIVTATRSACEITEQIRQASQNYR